MLAAAMAGVALAAAACGSSLVVASPAPSHGSGGPAGPSADAGAGIPRILVRSPDSTFSIIDPDQPDRRRPLVLPTGRWDVTTGPASVAITNMDPAGPRTILIGTVPDAAFVQGDALNLPAGGQWQGGYAACLSGAGLILAADAGAALWLVAPGEDPVKLPNQGNNNGTCAWLDDSRAVWEQENDRVATFDLESGTTTQLPATEIVGDLSGGQGRVAGSTAQHGIAVNRYTLTGPSLEIGPPIGHIDPDVGGRLSPDGRWLLTSGTDAVARVYRVDATGLTKVGSVALRPAERVEWMPEPDR